MDVNGYLNKPIALLIVNEADENDMHVYLGKLEKDGLDFRFKNESKGWNLLLNDEQLARTSEVSQDLKDIFLGADFFITLTMGNISDEEALKAIPTGMKWH